ncbi:MAG: hypothetical protein ACKV22_21390 [Bryobacteraceae bacterium]
MGLGGVVPEIVLAAAGVALALAGVSILWNARRDVSGRERRRVTHVNRVGRMGEATVTEFRDHTIYYRYELRGVAYAASQDVSALERYLPANPSMLIGNTAIKYHPRNPANSIVLCEGWNGLRTMPRENSAVKEEEEVI